MESTVRKAGRGQDVLKEELRGADVIGTQWLEGTGRERTPPQLRAAETVDYRQSWGVEAEAVQGHYAV